MANVAIQIDDLAKRYRLGVISHRTLARDLQSWWARMHGIEDPNSLVAPLGHQALSTADGFFWALDGVSLQVREGEVLGIIGRNGAGKSTLLKILSRITAPSRGVVRLRGRVASLLEVGTGFHPELTGRENVYLNGAILGMSRDEVRRKFDEIVAFAEIDRFIDTPVKRYSSGMYVRLAFAVAAHLEPEILIVDEVLAVGDAEFQRKCLGKMGEVAGGGRTVLFVSHNMQAVRNLCNRGVLLERGAIISDGQSADVVNEYLSSLQTLKHFREINHEMHGCTPAEFEITSVEILDERSETTSTITSGKPFRVGLHYRVRNGEYRYRIGISIYSPDQTRIATVISNFDGEQNFRGESGKRYLIVVKLDNILSTGTYHMNIHVKNSHGTYVDILENIPLTVIMPPDSQRSSREQGLVSIPATWERPIEE